MEVSEDVEILGEDDEVLSSEQVEKEMNDIISKESVNTNFSIESLRFKPRKKSKLCIPLCRMIALLVVRPFLRNDVMNLASHFVSNGYMEGNGVFYVALENHEGKTAEVTSEIEASWDPLWIEANAAFEDDLLRDDDLKIFLGMMFHVWDGNHRLQAWFPIINRDHACDRNWHVAVESIILEVNGVVPTVLSALYQVNWYVSYTFLIYFQYH
jgi:hypothetical protein